MRPIIGIIKDSQTSRKKHRHYFKWYETGSRGHVNVGFFKCKCGKKEPGYKMPNCKPLRYKTTRDEK